MIDTPPNNITDSSHISASSLKNSMNKNRHNFDNYILPKYKNLSPY